MRIIFHHPLPLDNKTKSGSGVRPIKMLNAFNELGFEIDLVTGYSNERKKKIDSVVQNIRKGIKYDFCYSESSTMPTLLCDENHIPLHPFMDFDFFKKLKLNSIPIGLFYRDIYWRFPELYDNKVGKIKSFIAKLFYRYDLKKYQTLVSKLYIPSDRMSKYIPLKNTEFTKPLPPGGENIIGKFYSPTEPIKILFVGGFNDNYKMHKLFKVMKNFPNISLTVCNREKEWQTFKNEYIEYMCPNIEIVHKSGKDLFDLYANSNIASIFVEPHLYWEFAAPVKLFEYLGMGKPIIATSNTFAGDFVEKNDIGWSIEYSEIAIIKLLNNLQKNFNEVITKADNCIKIAADNTWLARARQVEFDLLGKS